MAATSLIGCNFHWKPLKEYAERNTNTRPDSQALSKMVAADDEFFASLERNFTGIGCTMKAQTTVSDSTQCGLFYW